MMDTSISSHDPDTIDGYLAEPIVNNNEIEQAGGILGYWEQALSTRPRVARYAFDNISAPDT
jgi:hypothetical protein